MNKNSKVKEEEEGKSVLGLNPENRKMFANATIDTSKGDTIQASLGLAEDAENFSLNNLDLANLERQHELAFLITAIANPVELPDIFMAIDKEWSGLKYETKAEVIKYVAQKASDDMYAYLVLKGFNFMAEHVSQMGELLASSDDIK